MFLATRIVTVAGPDRQAFLQGQLTQDVGRASDRSTAFAGWADAKGRLLWAGHLFTRNEAFCLLVPAELADAVVKRLRMFVLRAKAEVAVTDLVTVGVLGKTPMHAGLPSGWQDLEVALDPGRRLLVGVAADAAEVPTSLAPACASPDGWRLLDIRAGFPEVTTATSGAFVPQMVNLDLLDGISFTKGCYTGQEIVARTKYRGRVRRRMLRFALAGAVPVAGEAVYAERGVVGKIVSAAPVDDGSELLAVVGLDDLPGPFFADSAHSRALRHLSLPYPIPELAA
jgi:folate-binding protein YgfZ